MNILFFDVETNNFRQNRIIQLAFEVVRMHDQKSIEKACTLISPNGWRLDDEGFHKGRFTHEQCWKEGLPIRVVLPRFMERVQKSDLVVAHNAAFDLRILKGECDLLEIPFPQIQTLCTMQTTRNITRIPNKANGGYKPPTLTELHRFLFKSDFEGGHSADVDVEVTKKCFFELTRLKAYFL